MNISLPKEMAQYVDKEVKRGKYATVSEFMRQLLRNWERDRVLEEIEQGRAEIRAGNGKVLKSLRDLRS